MVTGNASVLPAELPGWKAVPTILQRIKAPSFPARDVDAVHFGARPDGLTDCRPAFTQAIAVAAQAGGGRVVVSAGHYLCNGPLHLLSNVNLHLAEGATLLFGAHPGDYLVGDRKYGGGVLTRWEGTRCYNYSPLIYAYRQQNIAVTGRGTIDGQAGTGWGAWQKQQDPDRKVLRQMGQDGTPVEQRLFGKGHLLRPSLFQPYECQNVLVEGVTLKSSPFWTIHPVFCRNVVVRNVTVLPGTTNDDGCDPESCTDVLIDSCSFNTRDDNIAIKAGRDNDAWAANGGRPCENIIIRNCHFVSGEPGGVSIGSEMSGDVRNVFVENCRMDHCDYALFVKANPDRGGIVENFHVRDVTINSCGYLLRLEMNYKNLERGQFIPLFRNITVERVTGTTAGRAGISFYGLPTATMENIALRDVCIGRAAAPLEMRYAQNVRFSNVTVNGQPLMPPGP